MSKSTLLFERHFPPAQIWVQRYYKFLKYQRKRGFFYKKNVIYEIDVAKY